MRCHRWRRHGRCQVWQRAPGLATADPLGDREWNYDHLLAYHAVFHFDAALDDLIAVGRIQPVIAVVLSGNTSFEDKATEWANGPTPNARWDTYVARDVVGAVDQRYRTVPTAAARAVAGYSAGADGAINQLVLHATFGVAGLLSPDLVQDPGTVNHDATIIRR